MAAINNPVINTAGTAAGKTFAQINMQGNTHNSQAGSVLKPCFKPGCALNCKHKAATCFKAATQQAC